MGDELPELILKVFIKTFILKFFQVERNLKWKGQTIFPQNCNLFFFKMPAIKFLNTTLCSGWGHYYVRTRVCAYMKKCVLKRGYNTRNFSISKTYWL